MRRLRTMSTRRLVAIGAIVVAIAVTGGIAQAALSGGDGPTPPPKALDRAVFQALKAPEVQGVTARVTFTNNLLPSGTVPGHGTSPLASGASGRLWVANDGRFRVELQSNDRGDVQVFSDGKQVTVFDATSNTVYKADLPQEQGQGKAEQHQPATLAGVQKALARLGGTWTLSNAQPTSTAGQPTYTVKITPKDSGGLLGAAELAWDATHGVPLRAAIFASGQSSPVLGLTATSVSYGAVPASDLSVSVPQGAKVVDLSAKQQGHAQGADHGAPVTGVAAVQRELGFKLSAPAEIAGLQRSEVRLVRTGDEPAALVLYGKGLGSVAVLEHANGQGAGKDGGAPGTSELRLPQVNVNGATGTELATPLGTVLTFERGNVSYAVAGLVPPVAAENVARGL